MTYYLGVRGMSGDTNKFQWIPYAHGGQNNEPNLQFRTKPETLTGRSENLRPMAEESKNRSRKANQPGGSTQEVFDGRTNPQASQRSWQGSTASSTRTTR